MLSGTRSVSVSVTGPASILSGEALTETVQVLADDDGTPASGIVTLLEGPVTLGTAPLDATGTARFDLPTLPRGNHVLKALYAGNGDLLPSAGSGYVSVLEGQIAVALTAPTGGSTIDAATGTTLVASAIPAGTTRVTKVAFFADGLQLAEVTSPPYSFAWAGMPAGAHTLSVSAWSDSGTQYDSALVTITVSVGATAAKITYFHQDLVGNTVAASDATGHFVYTEEYRPYGERLVKAPAAASGQPASNAIWFHGKIEDADTGLQYFGARYYDPMLGRFMGIDPAGVDAGNLHSFNRYAYGNNNPYRYRDPDGKNAAAIVVAGVTLTAITIAYVKYQLRPDGPIARDISRGWKALKGLLNENANETDQAAAGGHGANDGESKNGKKDTLQPGPHAGDSIPARGPGRDFSKEERDKINEIGQNTGCHTCGSKSPGTSSGNHIPDHQPPNALNPPGGTQELYPHCLTCSRIQGGQVRGAKNRSDGGSN